MNRFKYTLGLPRPGIIRLGQVWYNHNASAVPKQLTITSKEEDLWKDEHGHYISEDILFQYFTLEPL